MTYSRQGHVECCVREGPESHLQALLASTLPIVQYRLRVGDIRVFYDVVEARVEILAIFFKPRVDEWLQEVGRPL